MTTDRGIFLELRGDELRVIAEAVGARFDGKDKSRCPIPSHNDRDPSFWLGPDHYYCFGCGFHGDGPDLIAAIEGGSKWDCIVRCCEITGRPIPHRTPEASERYETTRNIQDLMSSVHQDALRHRTRAEAYIRSRKIDPALSPDAGYLPKNYMPRDVGLAIKAGVVVENEGKRPFCLLSDRVVWPIRSAGRIVTLYGRSPAPSSERRHMFPKRTAHYETPPWLYGLDSVKRGDHVVLTEGIFDYLTAKTWALTPVTRIAVTATQRGDGPLALLKSRGVASVTVVFDYDPLSETGQSGGLKAAQTLFKLGVPVKIKRLPPGVRDA